jgi:hypothetical protein
VIDNQLTAKLTGKIGDLSNYMLKSIVSQAVRSTLDSVAFTTGQLLELDLIGLLRDDVQKADGSFAFHYFDPCDEVVAARKTKLTAQEVAALFTEAGIPLRRCLKDLHMALKDPAGSPFYCYRALETVKGHLGSKAGEVKDNRQWEVMREALRVERAEIEKVKKHADPLRQRSNLPGRRVAADDQHHLEYRRSLHQTSAGGEAGRRGQVAVDGGVRFNVELCSGWWNSH